MEVLVRRFRRHHLADSRYAIHLVGKREMGCAFEAQAAPNRSIPSYMMPREIVLSLIAAAAHRCSHAATVHKPGRCHPVPAS
jgi:hypothetical protein